MSARIASATRMDAAALRTRLHALCALLDDGGALLEAVPFRDPDPPWLQTAPALAARLLGLADAELDHLELDPDALLELLATAEPGLRDLFRTLAECQAVADWPDLQTPRPGDAAPRAPATEGISERKAAQVRAFAAAQPQASAPLVEWCSGKGHVGRLLATRDAVDARCLERDARLHPRDGADPRLRFESCDVLLDHPPLHAHERVVALHACGRLHEALIERVASERVHSVALAPCCYHLLGAGADAWRAMSRSGPQAPLAIDLVRLAVRETVTAPARVRRARRVERAYRLAFDRLQRDLRGIDAPLPLPSLPTAAVANGFAAFCAQAARLRGLPLPDGLDLQPWLTLGERLEARTRRLDLARAGFRRVLELRMVLDRALCLAEAGYEVGVGRFCARALTPRNLLIRAV
ncbi:MAG TPA: methyltransferase [Pseudomonadales bacterium]|nr:methyltransferase [Pseudomonadales bacterium]